MMSKCYWVPYTIQYAYNETSADLTGMTYPFGLALAFSRDANGQVSGIAAGGTTLISNAAWQPFGPLKNMTAGTLSVTRSFNQRYLMTGIQAGSVMNLTYTHDGAGNVKTISGVTQPPLSPGVTDYTHTGNRLTASTGKVTKTYTHDNAGNIISDGTRTFIYNQNNRLAQVKEGSAVIAEYTYDGFGRRVKKTVGSEIVHYHYDLSGLLICETDGNGNAIRDYVYLNGEPVAMQLYGDDAGWYYFVNDHLGTPQKVVDASGSVLWEAGYLPFGEARILVADIENNLRFPGQYYDAETGLHYNWNRYYDPESGRYWTADPIGLAGGVNLYVYVQNNPVNWIDPLALEQISSIIVNQTASSVTVNYKNGTAKTHPAATGDGTTYPGANATASGLVTGTAWGPVGPWENTKKSWSPSNSDNPYGPAIIIITGTDSRHIHGTSGPMSNDLTHIGGSNPNDRKFTHGCARVSNLNIVLLCHFNR